MNLIIFAISFAVLRNLFGKYYNKMGLANKPVDIKGRFRRIFNRDDIRDKTVTNDLAGDLKEKMVPEDNENKSSINLESMDQIAEARAPYDYQPLAGDKEIPAEPTKSYIDASKSMMVKVGITKPKVKTTCRKSPVPLRK